MSIRLTEELVELVAGQLGVERTEVVAEARILDDLGADSLDVVELVMALEDAYDITVPDEAIERLHTLGDVQRYVEGSLATA